MIYITDNHKFVLNYQDVKNRYEDYCKMSNKEFMDNLSGATHLACLISYVKHLNPEMTVGDKGIVHELVHLWDIPTEPIFNLDAVRKKFKDYLKLS